MAFFSKIGVTALLLLGLAHANPLQKRASPVKTSVCSVATAPPNPKLHCDYEGNFNKPITPYSTTTTADFPTCRNSCLVDKHCESFGFESDNNQCTLYHVTVRKQHPRKTPSPIFYWNRKCFVANYTTSPLVINGGFQSGAFSPWQVGQLSGGGTAVVQSPGFHSSEAAYLSYPSSAAISDGVFIVQNGIQLCGGVTYEVSGAFYVESPAPAAGNSIFNVAVYIVSPFNIVYYYGNGLDAGSTTADQWNAITPGIFTPQNDGMYSFTSNLQQNGTSDGATVRLDTLSLVVQSNS